MMSSSEESSNGEMSYRVMRKWKRHYGEEEGGYNMKIVRPIVFYGVSFHGIFLGKKIISKVENVLVSVTRPIRK